MMDRVRLRREKRLECERTRGTAEEGGTTGAVWRPQAKTEALAFGRVRVSEKS